MSLPFHLSQNTALLSAHLHPSDGHVHVISVPWRQVFVSLVDERFSGLPWALTEHPSKPMGPHSLSHYPAALTRHSLFLLHFSRTVLPSMPLPGLEAAYSVGGSHMR